MQHFSHFIQPGASKLKIMGQRHQELAFQNPDGSTIFITNNRQDTARNLKVKIRNELFTIQTPAHSFNSVQIR